jgi:hypothetical protein
MEFVVQWGINSDHYYIYDGKNLYFIFPYHQNHVKIKKILFLKGIILERSKIGVIKKYTIPNDVYDILKTFSGYLIYDDNSTLKLID